MGSQTPSQLLRFYSLFIIGVLILSCQIETINSQSPELAPEELNTIIWLLRFYGNAAVGQTSNDICTSGQFQCQLGNDSKLHVTIIDLTVTSFQYVGEWNTLNVTEWVLPELLSLTINDVLSNTNDTVNPLTYIKNLPKLTNIRILNDIRITSIPTYFDQAVPVLETLTLQCQNITSIFPFFNITSLQLIDIEAPRLHWIILEDTTYALYLPNLKTLSIVMTSINDLNWELGPRGFPSLYSVTVKEQIAGNNSLIIFFSSPSVQEIRLATLGDKSSILPVLAYYPERVKVLQLSGLAARSNPSDLSSYPNLQEFSITDSNLTTIPLLTVPSSMTDLNFQNNQLSFDFGTQLSPTFLNNSPAQMKLTLTNNMGLTGFVTTGFCYTGGLFIKGTSISSLPECFWCYYDNTDILQTDLPSSTGSCSTGASLSNTTLISIRGSYIVEGTNIGWGGMTTALQPIIPNQKLQGLMNPRMGIIQNVTIDLKPSDPSFSFPVTIIEVGFLVDSIVILNQTLTSTKYLGIHYQFINLDHMPDITLEFDNTPCILESHDNSTNITICSITTNIVINNPTVLIKNGYTNQTFPIDFKGTIINSITIDNPTTTLILNGYFGTNITDGGGYIVINNTQIVNLTGTPTNISIQCSFSQLAPGPATITVFVPNGQYTSKSLLFIPYPLPTEVQCQIRTSNCSGHGTCVNGQCVCDPGWFDDCKLQSSTKPDVIFQESFIEPTPQFQYHDFTFSFQLIAIQELDVDNQIIKELPTAQWNVTNQSTSDTISINYQLVNKTTIDGKNLSLVSVLSNIGFSNQSRTITFGGEQIQLAPNSIKVGVNITNWPFDTVLSHLRVVFSTTINNEQIIVGCDGSQNQIDSFQNFIDGDSLQYLRVVKDDIQFFGRFIDFSVSDGIKTYSKTEVMNTSKVTDTQSLATIGIHLPQCLQCLLDPDFSSLIIDRSDLDGDGCGSKGNKNWRIIVGVVVGAVGAAGIAVVGYLIIRKNRFYFIHRSATKMDKLREKKLNKI